MLKKVILFLLVSLFLSAPAYVQAAETPTLLPIADGFYNQWTPKSGSVHYQMVDETVCNGVTDLNNTQVVGSRDSYVLNLNSVPNGATISEVSITPCASKKVNGSGTSVMNLFYRLNGVNSTNSNNYTFTGNNQPIVLSESNFSLSAIKTASSSLEVGALFSSGTKGLRLSQIATKLTYIPLLAPSNLSATPASAGGTLLNWTDNSSNEQGFKVERSTDSASFASIASVGANISSYLDAPLQTGLYYYRVRSFNIGAESSPSGVASVFVE